MGSSRYAAAIVLIALAVWLAGLNWRVFWLRHIRRVKASSWVPLIAGLLGAAGVALLPPPQVNRWWWAAFLLDWGSVPGILYSLIWRLRRPRPGE